MTEARKLIVNDTLDHIDVCWEYPDGSHRCITSKDCGLDQRSY